MITVPIPNFSDSSRNWKKEQRALVKELLGVDYRTEMNRYCVDENYEERMYGFLPAEKQDQLRALQSKYDDLEQEIYTRSKGMLLDEDQEQLRRDRKATRVRAGSGPHTGGVGGISASQFQHG